MNNAAKNEKPEGYEEIKRANAECERIQDLRYEFGTKELKKKLWAAERVAEAAWAKYPEAAQLILDEGY